MSTVEEPLVFQMILGFISWSVSNRVQVIGQPQCAVVLKPSVMSVPEMMFSFKWIRGKRQTNRAISTSGKNVILEYRNVSNPQIKKVQVEPGVFDCFQIKIRFFTQDDN